MCDGSHDLIFSSIAYGENGILVLFSIVVAYETQRHIPNYNNYHKYHESAVINLTTMLAILLSSVCQAVLIILQLNRINDGALLVTTLRDCLWMYPIIYLLFAPKVYHTCCMITWPIHMHNWLVMVSYVIALDDYLTICNDVSVIIVIKGS